MRSEANEPLLTSFGSSQPVIQLRNMAGFFGKDRFAVGRSVGEAGLQLSKMSVRERDKDRLPFHI
jgi:hypothetical protein